jgi:CubicO group peptidase (beta-lactamase class C family)
MPPLIVGTFLIHKQQSNHKTAETMSQQMKTNCLKFISILIFLLFLQTAQAQPGKKKDKELGVENFAALDGLVTQSQKLLGNDVVVLVWADTLVYKKELGAFNDKIQAPIASASKWLTAALILKLVDEGKLSLDDKVSDYLPIFSSYGKNYITLRQCLSHFTGIQAEQGIAGFLKRKKFESLEEEVNAWAAKEIQSNPGTEFRYSAAGLNIAGRVAEVVMKRKFDQLIKQKLFIPLGMTKTTFSTMDGSAVDPSGGAQSTAADYLKFLQMLLNNGQYNGKQILSAASVAEMRKTQTIPENIKSAPVTASGLGYALGAWVLDSNAAGVATALASPGLLGTWPMVDWCRGYASIFFVKTFFAREQRADMYLQMKQAIDEKFTDKCR